METTNSQPKRRGAISPIEMRVVGLLSEHAWILFLVAMGLIGFLARYSAKGFVSVDAQAFLLPWHGEIRANGLSTQVGDYGIPYQSIILFLTFLPINPLTAYKLISCCFDVVLCAEAYLLVMNITDSKKRAGFAAVSVFLLPTVMINSSVWSQCDSMYVSFCLAALRRLCEKKYPSSFFMLGLAFSFKLQTVFFVPVIVYAYILNKEFSVANVLWCLVGFMLPSIPGFLAGRSIFAPFEIYAAQTESYAEMMIGIPNFWGAVGGDYQTMGKLAILIVVGILGTGLCALLLRRSSKPLDRGEVVVLASWTAWTCVMFLPSMHERYIYPVTILLVVLSFWSLRIAPVCLAVELIELISYGAFLFSHKYDVVLTSMMALATYACFTYISLRVVGAFGSSLAQSR